MIFNKFLSAFIFGITLIFSYQPFSLIFNWQLQNYLYLLKLQFE